MEMVQETQEIFLENISSQNLIPNMMGTEETSKPLDGESGGGYVIPDPVTDPTYMELTDFERNLPYNEWRVWLGHNWKLAVHIGFLYAMGVFLGQKWMKRRQPYKLDNMLKIWNLLLAAFSLAGFLRSLPEVMHIFHRPNGFYRISCSRDEFNAASAYWSVIGVFSKVVELGDTAFLVLRKRPVIFLHWYHHVSVMMYTWSTFEDADPSHRWFTVMNYFVHAIMYTYYGLRAMGFTLNRTVSMVITSLQILQMIGGILFNIYGFYVLSQGLPCERKLNNVKLSLMMYLSFLILFAQFFYSSYFAGPRKKTRHVH